MSIVIVHLSNTPELPSISEPTTTGVRRIGAMAQHSAVVGARQFLAGCERIQEVHDAHEDAQQWVVHLAERARVIELTVKDDEALGIACKALELTADTPEQMFRALVAAVYEENGAALGEVCEALGILAEFGETEDDGDEPLEASADDEVDGQAPRATPVAA